MEPREVLSLDEINLSDRSLWARPLPEREGAFLTLRRERPISFHPEPEVPEEIGLAQGPGFWAVTKHADVQHVSRNPEIFCSGEGSNIGNLPAPFREFFGSMINTDDPRHARLRGIVSRGFTPRMIQRAEASVERTAAAIVDEVRPRGRCEFVSEIAARLPLAIICDMMGIPESQHDFVIEKTNVILGIGDPEFSNNVAEIVPKLLSAGAELAALAKDLGQHRRAHPAEDLTSALVNAALEGERLDDQEFGSFFVLLVVAGNETTRNAISHGLIALCEHPEQRALWQADFQGLAPSAVEEIVRWASPVIHFRRTATRDTEIRGQKIREGDKVVIWYGSANRDEEAFPDPFQFDLRRDPNEHVGFGGPGPHYCVGAHLARREIALTFQELFRKIPDIQVVGTPERLLSDFIHGVKRMQCEFTARET